MADPRNESGSRGQGQTPSSDEKREGASESSSERSGLPEHRDMSVRRDLGEGDKDNLTERLGTPTESSTE
ncbi:hypothetical protein F0U61_01825 [Archangium violaceum]|uniref:hypothetical protein n=1 Tax=Archangium violaceum TaxID=83451 RepID=UPI002B2E68F7|nr:hypothetical protein F0U61_01825 [Archangium violaceum]